jgi:hypothetical protein
LIRAFVETRKRYHAAAARPRSGRTQPPSGAHLAAAQGATPESAAIAGATQDIAAAAVV